MEKMIEKTVHLPEGLVAFIEDCAEYHSITWEEEVQNELEFLAKGRANRLPKLLAAQREARKASQSIT
jgi:hypothetical protein